MKHFFLTTILISTVLLAVCSCCNQTKTPAINQIPVDTPARPAGQTDVVGLACDPIDTVRIGFIGLGDRGSEAVRRFTYQQGVKIKALCDLHQQRVDSCQKLLTAAVLPAATSYSGSEDAWKQLCERDDIDLVYIATDWLSHTPMMIYAMEHGKHVACEVPAVLSMDEIWQVINTAERTRKHCMQLENCVYDFFEITTLNMAQQGVFGDILHVEGAYIHCLEEVWAHYNDNWRMDYNRKHRGDIYPTHGLGPACQLLDIHRGDKMNYLVSVDVAPVSLPDYLKSKNEDATGFQNGEHTITLIRTEKGKTIQIQHNVASPRPYNRMYQLTGTKGFANKYPLEGYALSSADLPDDIKSKYNNLTPHEYMPEAAKEMLMASYKDPIVAELESKAKEVGGHGGMDFIMDYRLIYCLRNGLPLDMDVYDLAEWCSLIPLTAVSLENGSMPVQIPDFTRGAWDKVKGYRHAFAH